MHSKRIYYFKDNSCYIHQQLHVLHKLNYKYALVPLLETEMCNLHIIGHFWGIISDRTSDII
jgi:hypothetical protein